MRQNKGAKPGSLLPRGEAERQRTLANLQGRTGEGVQRRAIEAEMEALANEYYDEMPAKPPPTGVAQAHAGSLPLAKEYQFVAQVRQSGWTAGPRHADGRIIDASDRNLLCMDVRGREVVVGSADHGLVVFDVNTAAPLRKLFGKNSGHTEWVTCCCFAPDGKILSGGMDSKLCLWTGVRASDLLAHRGSISQLEVNQNSIAVSASYDRTLRLWDLRSKSCLSTLSGHRDPVVQFAWLGLTLVSGDRKGGLLLWDVEAGQPVASLATKGGQIGAIENMISGDMNLTLIGDQTGTLTAFDWRASSKSPVFREIVHPGGVLSGIRTIKTSTTPSLFVTAGADKKMICFDCRKNFAPVFKLEEHRDFIYSLDTYGPLILSGAGNGWLLVHDSSSGKCLYGLGANAAAIRCIHASEQHLVCAGDDGKAIVYDM